MKSEDNVTTHTMADTPPPITKEPRRSMWTELFNECRGFAGQWRRTTRSFSQKSAAQYSSDIRNAHRRDPASMRMRGLRQGEGWEAVWGPDPTQPDPERCYIWLRQTRPAVSPATAGRLVSVPTPPPSTDHLEAAW